MRKSKSVAVVLPPAVISPPLVAAAAPVFAACIGLDRADRKLDVCLQVAAANGAAPARPEVSVLPNEPGALHEWVAQLRQRFGGAAVAVAFEQPAAALLHLFAG
jgi:hypothetical protein